MCKSASIYFYRLVGHAAKRPLTQQECFVHGQLLAMFEQACWAKARGYKGRCYVIPEEKIDAILGGMKP